MVSLFFSHRFTLLFCYVPLRCSIHFVVDLFTSFPLLRSTLISFVVVTWCLRPDFTLHSVRSTLLRSCLRCSFVHFSVSFISILYDHRTALRRSSFRRVISLLFICFRCVAMGVIPRPPVIVLRFPGVVVRTFRCYVVVDRFVADLRLLLLRLRCTLLFSILHSPDFTFVYVTFHVFPTFAFVSDC